MTMLRNAWYVAGWADDLVQGQLTGRTFLNEPVVMYRQVDGTPVALSDLCPHRFAPLHLGKQLGDVVQCGYHGLEFSADGRCVRNPHGGIVPPGAKLRKYPLVERHNVLWIWPGERQADDSLIPNEFAYLSDTRRAHVRGYIHAKANYLLLLDNLMDPAHALYLHSSLVSDDMRDNYEPEVGISEGVTTRTLYQASVAPPSLFAGGLPPGTQRVDLNDIVRGHIPSNVMHDVAYSQPGKPPYSEGGASFRSAHLFTPETETTSHYFYGLSRDFHRDSPEVQTTLERELRKIFTTEDIPMIEAQQELIGNRDLMTMRPALLVTDKADVLMRRQLASLIAKENASAAA